MADARAPRPSAAYAGFAVFGAFWGTWGASIPAIRDRAGVSDEQLGSALLCVGLGALPAMLVAGRLVDRWGGRVAGAFLAALGASGVLVAAGAHDVASLAVALGLVGAASGAADVAINATAGAAQRASGRPVISRCHATFSGAVVATGLAAGALRAGGAAALAPFALVLLVAAAVAAWLARTGPPAGAAARRPRARRPADGAAVGVALLLGGLGALGFAVENGHQSWSALYLHDALGAGPATAAAGPAVFAGVVACTRMVTGGLGARRPVGVLSGGALAAAGGTATVAIAASVPVALLGLGLAAAGTAVLFPTLLGVLTLHVPEATRGRATSMLTAVAYLGFLGGPVYVGAWAGASGLPGAMAALAAVAAALAVIGAPVLRRARRSGSAPDACTGSAARSSGAADVCPAFGHVGSPRQPH